MTCRFLLPLAIAIALIASPGRGTTKPNIILVLIDDMGWPDFSCFGNKEAHTPNIDRLAAEGLAFEQFYVNSPICSPSRVAFSTGQYPQRWKIGSYLAHRKDNAKRGIANWLDPKAPVLARSLKQAGYATGHFGKWHMGGQRDVTDAPPITAYGFDESLTNFEGMGPKLLPLTLKPGQKEPKKIWSNATILGKPVTWMLRCRITGGFVDAAIPFMTNARKADKPFYINLWPDDVHGPYWPSVGRWDANKRPRYMAVLEEMDQQLGKLFDYVRNTPALRNNTLILVCSDNGTEPSVMRRDAELLRGCKGTLFEGGIRSPLVVWGPGFIAQDKAGTRNANSLFCAIDLVPSLLRFADVEAPAGIRYDGEDVLDTLLGKSAASRTNPIYYRRPPDRRSFRWFKNLPALAIRDKQWKLLCDYGGENLQLYNIVADRGETTNLAAAHPELAAKLAAKVTAWHKKIPSDNGPNL